MVRSAASWARRHASGRVTPESKVARSAATAPATSPSAASPAAIAAVGGPGGPALGSGAVGVVVIGEAYEPHYPGPVRGRERLDLRGGTAVITGAAGGMGALHAARALDEGASVVLLDRDGAALEATAAALAAPDRTSTHVVDVADRAALEAVAGAVLAAHGAPALVVNNAGVVRAGNSWEVDPAAVEATLAVNLAAPIHLNRALLPAMVADASRRRAVLDVSSASATVPVPRMSAYAASKWALLGYGESLRLELVQAGHHHVGVTTFCPSYVSTGMFAGARGPLMTPIMTPQRAVAAAWRGLLSNTPVVLAPASVVIGPLLRGTLPTRAFDVVARRLGVYSSMDAFTGRPQTAPEPSARSARG